MLTARILQSPNHFLSSHLRAIAFAACGVSGAGLSGCGSSEAHDSGGAALASTGDPFVGLAPRQVAEIPPVTGLSFVDRATAILHISEMYGSPNATYQWENGSTGERWDWPRLDAFMPPADRQRACVNSSHSVIRFHSADEGGPIGGAETRELLPHGMWRMVRVSPDRKWLVGLGRPGVSCDDEPGWGELWVAPLSGDAGARSLGRVEAPFEFLGSKIVVLFEGGLRAFDPARPTVAWTAETFGTNFGGGRMPYVTYNADRSRAFLHTGSDALFVSPDGWVVRASVPQSHLTDIESRGVLTKFGPDGKRVYAVRGDGGPVKPFYQPEESIGDLYEYDEASVRLVARGLYAYFDGLTQHAFEISPDGSKLVYLLASRFPWTPPTIYDLRHGTTASVACDDCELPFGGHPEFLADSKRVWLRSLRPTLLTPVKGAYETSPLAPGYVATFHPNRSNRPVIAGASEGFLFNLASETTGPGRIVFRSADHPRIKEFGITSYAPTEPFVQPRRELPAFDIGPRSDGQQAAIIHAYVRPDSGQAQHAWLVSLTHQQKCVELRANAPTNVHWGKGILTYQGRGLHAATSDGLFQATLIETMEWRRDSTATFGDSVFVAKDGSLLRIDLPSHRQELPADDGQPHPELGCVER